MQALDISFDGGRILGRPEDLSHPWGLFVRKDGFQGWGGLPAGRREVLARAVTHGEHDTPVYLPSRVVTIDGWAIESSPVKLQYLLDTVAGLGAPGQLTRMSVTQWGRELHADGRRLLSEADDQGRWQGPNIRAAFQLQVLFPDPRKYGAVEEFPESGRATAFTLRHRGNFPSFPVIEIPSAPSAYTVTSPGGTFVVSGATSGGLHLVELRTGRVTRNGVLMEGVGRGDLWAVPAGEDWAHTVSVPATGRIADTFV